MDPYSSYSRTTRGKGLKIEVGLGTVFKVVYSIVGPYRPFRTKGCFHDFRGASFLGGSYSSTDLAHKSRHIWWDNLGVVSGFSLGWKCDFVVVMCFHKAK
jgi:hypothetical protein